jgi:hypothetical protein
MNTFQWIACSILAAAVMLDLLPGRRSVSWIVRVSRSAIWCLAMAAIANPTWVTRFANLLGVGRGADIVLYVLALAFVSVTFFLYAQQLRFRRELSRLVTHLALTKPQFGGGGPAAPDPPSVSEVPS